MSRLVNDSTTCFQGTNFSSHKPYILDPGGFANTAVLKFQQAPIGAFLQGSKIFSNSKYFNDPISPVGSRTSNIRVCQTKFQGSQRNIFQKSFENSKIHVQKVTPNKITINIPLKKEETCCKS
jgi:hypothetical protein